MDFPFDLNFPLPPFSSGVNRTITINSGFTIFVGPNGSGKTQILRGAKSALGSMLGGKKMRFLSAGRLSMLENYRSNYDGLRGETPQYDGGNLGGKNNRENRHLAETAYGDFHTLYLRPDIQIKVAERLRILFNRDIFLEWDEGKLKVNFVRLDFGSPYPSAREASGLLQLVVLLAALYDDEVGALIIDEPEVSLHPQLQAFLLNEILSVEGNPDSVGKKLVLIATHSTEMIALRRPIDLTNFVFCYNILENPLQISSKAGELQNQKLQTLIASLSREHKLTFFCIKPVLLEGTSDEIIASGINRKLSLNLEAAGSQFLSVYGKGSFPPVVKLMRLIGKSPVVIADADAFADNLGVINSFCNDSYADTVAQHEGHASGIEFAKAVYDNFCNMVDSNWQDIEQYAIKSLYWITRDPQNEEISKRRAVFTTLLNMENHERASLFHGEEWDRLYTRLLALLNFLENIGCFILRKGTIEAYFKTTLTKDKPLTALNEVERLLTDTESSIRRDYNDIIRALEYAAKVPAINEATAIRSLLLALAAPALAILTLNTSENELQLLARNLLGERASLFSLRPNLDMNSKLELVIDINSHILKLQNFPVHLSKNCNVNDEVNRQLGIV